MKKLKDRFSNATRAITIITIIAIVVSLLMVTFAYEEAETSESPAPPEMAVTYESVEIATPAPPDQPPAAAANAETPQEWNDGDGFIGIAPTSIPNLTPGGSCGGAASGGIPTDDPTPPTGGGGSGGTPAHTCSFGGWSRYQNATCTASSRYYRSCTGCPNWQSDAFGQPLGHSGALSGNSAATCTVAGREGRRVCNRGGCGVVTNAGTAIPAPGHDWDVENSIIEQAPTCLEEGLGIMFCGREGCDTQETVAPDPLGHSMGEWFATIPPTTGAEGEDRRECDRDDCEHYETRIVPRLWVVTFTATYDGFIFSGSGEFYQGVANGDSASLPIMERYSDCGRRIWTGWDHDGANIVADIEISPTAPEVRMHTVTFVLNNNGIEGTLTGGGAMAQEIEHSMNAELPAAHPPYGHSMRWGGGSDHLNIKNPVTITAQYDLLRFEVLFLNHDGSVISTQSISYGSGATAPDVPGRRGFEFAGWDKDFSRISSHLVVTALFRQLATTEVPTCNHPGCDEEEGLCDICDRCEEHCTCCVVDGCGNTAECSDCGRCAHHCDCTTWVLLGRPDGTTTIIREIDVPEAALMGFEGFSIIPIALQGTPPLFTFMGRNVYLWAPFQVSSWALVNLLLTVLGIILFVIKAVSANFVKKKKEQLESSEDTYVDFLAGKNKFLLITGGLSMVALILFFVTQNLIALIALFDIWTIVHTAIFIATIVTLKLYSGTDETNESDDKTEITSIYEQETEITDDKTMT